MNNRHIDVLVYGTVCLDAIWRVEALPEVDGFASILDERTTSGGEALNTCAALHTWGVHAVLAGNPIGIDDRGIKLMELIQRDTPGLDMRFVEISDTASTPFCACVATPDGKRTMFGTGFDGMRSPPPESLPLENVHWFTMDPNAWHAGVSTGLAAAQAGCKVLAMDFLDSPEICRAAKVNLTSSSRLSTGLSPSELLYKAQTLRDQFGQTVIITHGEEGCFVAESGESSGYHLPAIKAPEVVDCTGAGDVFRAGLLYGLGRDWPIPNCVRFAAGAAALNCCAPGGWAGVVSLEKTLAFVEAAECGSC